MSFQPSGSRQAGSEQAARGAAPERDSIVRVGWKVALGYDRLPSVRHTVTNHGQVEAEVRYVLLPAPAWCKA